MVYIIGIDIGGTKTSVSLGNPSGEILVRRVYPTTSFPATLGEAKRIIRTFLNEYDRGLKKTKGIGISCAGPLDLKKGTVVSPPNMPSWRNVALRQTLARSFPLPVFMDNDANCAAKAEKMFGAGKNVDNLFYYTVSTGIGGGIIIAGKIYHGVTVDAGEIGHTILLPEGPKCGCGKRGCLEALASGTAIARIAREKATKKSLILKIAGQKKNINAVHVAQAARRGDRLAQTIFDQASFYLAISVANVIQVLNPEMIVIGGGVSKVGSLLFTPLKRYVAKFSWARPRNKCKIVPAALKDKVGDLGAISLVL
ncbi:ROK family protein [Candidatus Omnitrophota bacterium]